MVFYVMKLTIMACAIILIMMGIAVLLTMVKFVLNLTIEEFALIQFKVELTKHKIYGGK